MRRIVTIAMTCAAAGGLAGCAATDRVLFVTKTSLGVDFDAQAATASIGYDRVEGYFAPRYDEGGLPPVVASVKSDGRIFNPRIRQLYATGDAAEIVLKRAKPGKGPEMKGDKKLMFFGTTTTTGIKVGFSSALPDSVTFGFKRKEFSVIPVGTMKVDGKEVVDVYPSVIASIDTAANADQPSTTGLNNTQFFATGQAARLLAARGSTRDTFSERAIEDLKAAQLDNVKAFEKVSVEKAMLVDRIGTLFDDADDAAKTAIVALAQKNQNLVPKPELDSFSDDLFIFSKSPPLKVDAVAELTKLEQSIRNLLDNQGKPK